MADERPRQRQRQRRALSAARAGGRLSSGGEPAAAAALVAALRAAHGGEAAARALTHGFHAYPARLHPATARALVALCLPERARAAVLLDPFCGSGTVLVEAMVAGAGAVGVDANPLAVGIARVRTWRATAAELGRLRARAQAAAAQVVAEGKAARRAGFEPPARRARIDGELAGWFAPHVRRELEALADRVAAERAADPAIGEALTLAMSSILYKVSKRASDTSVETVDRRVGRGNVARLFARRVDELAAGLGALAAAAKGTARVVAGDARALGAAGLGDRSVDAVVTSPPYPGTYDYLEHHGLRLAFLGLDAGALAKEEIGARRHFRGGARGAEVALAAWRRDLGAFLAEIARVLRPGGRTAIVLGDSLAAGRAVRAGDEVAAAAGRRLRMIAWAAEERPPYGAGEQAAFARAAKQERVVLLERPVDEHGR